LILIDGWCSFDFDEEEEKEKKPAVMEDVEDEEPEEPETWKCDICTYDNAASRANCEMCENPKPA